MTYPDTGFDGACRNLVAGYCRNLDTRNLDGLVGVFAPDGVVVTSGKEKVGRDAIRAWYGDVFTRNTPGLHFLGNMILNQTGPESGASVSDELYYRKNPEGVWAIQARFVYTDTFVLIDAEWLIARHEMVIVND